MWKNNRPWRRSFGHHWQKGGTVNGNDTETGNDPEPLFQRYERDAWSFHAPYLPQYGHHHHGHDHADCVYVAVCVCVRWRHSNRDRELCELPVAWDPADCDCERDLLYGVSFVYRCATGDH